MRVTVYKFCKIDLIICFHVKKKPGMVILKKKKKEESLSTNQTSLWHDAPEFVPVNTIN